MVLKWAGFAVFVVAVSGLGWGIAGFVEHTGCPDGRNRCAGSPEVLKYFAAVMICGFGLVPGFGSAIRTNDWRPVLGMPVGAVIGSGIALWHGRSLGFWILVGVLLVGTSALTLAMRAGLAALSPTNPANRPPER
ncbi:hypothetical protein ACFYWX_12630 [Streptomyces sp. NPDC002888]|uniref:hypothetical protein n=1 Tax=Streptomyces sp. NPDC002888 TaxID=3364668 RepID=UPI00369C30F9